MSDQPTPASQPTDPAAGLDPAALLQRGISTTPPAKRPPPPTPAELEAQLPELAVHELIGQGGMGAVYRATQRNLDRPVALKVMSRDLGADPAFAARFVREAKAMARLSHPGIVAVHAFGQRGDLCWLVMELVDGANLREVMRTGRLSASQALAIVPQLCDALQYAHDEGVIHRDIKPENILLDQRGRVKITDFGLAKVPESDRPLGEALTASGDRLGTVHYMAPEQVEGAKSVDHRVDIYSLGVVFYEMLTGGLPLGRFEPPSRRIAVDVRIDEVVLKALEKDPERRWQQASEVQRAVESGCVPAAKEAGVQKSVAKPGTLVLEIPRWLPVAAAVAAVAALVLLYARSTTHQPSISVTSKPPVSVGTVETFDLERERAVIRRHLQMGDVTAVRAGIARIVSHDPQVPIDDLVRDVDILEAQPRPGQDIEVTYDAMQRLLRRHPQDAVVARFIFETIGEGSDRVVVAEALSLLDGVRSKAEVKEVWYALYCKELSDTALQRLAALLMKVEIPEADMRVITIDDSPPYTMEMNAWHIRVLEQQKGRYPVQLRAKYHVVQALGTMDVAQARAEALRAQELGRTLAGDSVLNGKWVEWVVDSFGRVRHAEHFEAVVPPLLTLADPAVWLQVIEEKTPIAEDVSSEAEVMKVRLSRLRELLSASPPAPARP